MNKFKIWAPKAKKVDLVANEKVFKMQQKSSGLWETQAKGLKDPVLYGYKIDDKGPYPDPESRFQPDGVHGKSLLWHDDFAWNDQNWQPKPHGEGIFYEMHTGTFSPEGNYAGIISRLDYLRKLGVTHIELMPVAAFPGQRGWGYDGVALFAPHNTYGTPENLKQLVDACHQKRLAIVLDVVYNHLGPDGNYLGVYGPYFSDRYHTPWGEAVNYDDAESDNVREFVINNALMWLRDFHFDGLRLDAVHAIYDRSALHILEELQSRVDRLSEETGKTYCLIAESDLNDPEILYPPERGGYGLAAQWHDDFHHALHVMLTGEQQSYYKNYRGHEDLNKCLQSFFVFDGCYSPTRRRRHGRRAEGIGPEKFVVFTQNHDQVGNRGLGERLCHLISFEKCQIAAAIMLLSPFVPMIFQGEEWAASTPYLYFTDHKDAKLARSVREGRRREYAFLNKKIPDPQAQKTFARSVLNWQEKCDGQHFQMYEWYEKLIQIRQKYLKKIRKCRCSFLPLNKSNELFLYEAGALKLLINLGNRAHSLRRSEFSAPQILLQNNPVEISEKSLKVPAGSAVVFLSGN